MPTPVTVIIPLYNKVDYIERTLSVPFRLKPIPIGRSLLSMMVQPTEGQIECRVALRQMGVFNLSSSPMQGQGRLAIEG
jgi:hypothetical protein